ncbi:uncharacterized protein LOC132743293 isoform X2 [Ruditapes philippinarum]|uniref:uncharacterized protein LOC132743293 isoform X2 n=1 Tax=Ruditapes philippinarum TaxID=129788 RepID=UPI00295B2672|nr:uncharacterized protein LOC132743293 isoform X2 [Ruditapes philippinarum]
MWIENGRKEMIKMRSTWSMAESENIQTGKRNVLQAAGFLVAAEVFGVCLQEVHAHAKELQPLHRHFELPIILTVVDTISLFILLRLESLHGLRKHAEGLIVTFLCHFVVEYLFNYWYIYSRNDSFAVGYFEPVILVVLLKWCTRIDVSAQTFAILTVMALCAGVTSGEVHILLNTNRNGIIIFLVIFFTCLRNIGLSYLHNDGLVLRFRKSIAIPYSFTILSVALIMSAFHLTFWALPVMFSLIAMFASVTMLYMTSSLLENYSLVSLSVFGLVSQIFVNIVCIPVEHGHNIFISIIGALLLIIVIGVYIRFNLKNTQDILSPQVPNHEVYTRLEFLIFTGMVCGLILYVFKPKFSERDLNNLHYVGLDNIVKRLINHE